MTVRTVVHIPSDNHMHAVKRTMPAAYVTIDAKKEEISVTLSSPHKSAWHVEPLIFDHVQGRTYAAFDLPGEEEKKADITERQDLIERLALKKSLICSKELRKKLFAIFADWNHLQMPFYEGGLTVEHLILLNRFPGYPRSFYDAIPLANRSFRIEESFREVAEQIGNYWNIDSTYHILDLPEKEALRRAIIERPGLLFYAAEIRAIPFQNHDVLLAILKSERVYRLLSTIHLFPKTLAFAKELIIAIGETYAWRYMESNVNSLVEIGAYFLFQFDGTNAQQLLQGNTCNPSEYWLEPDILSSTFNIAVPYKSDYLALEDHIDGFFFYVLGCTHDFALATRDLGNCLYEYWINMDSTEEAIVGVKNAGTYVAIITVSKNGIGEASAERNRNIDEFDDLYSAVLAWSTRHRLLVSQSDMEEGEDGII